VVRHPFGQSGFVCRANANTPLTSTKAPTKINLKRLLERKPILLRIDKVNVDIPIFVFIINLVLVKQYYKSKKKTTFPIQIGFTPDMTAATTGSHCSGGLIVGTFTILNFVPLLNLVHQFSQKRFAPVGVPL